jgi:hypothetical protein
MWESISHDDIDQAREQLGSLHEEMLRRHAEELRGLDGELAEIETLERLIGAFAEKYKKAASSFETNEAASTGKETSSTESNGSANFGPLPESAIVHPLRTVFGSRNS